MENGKSFDIHIWYDLPRYKFNDEHVTQVDETDVIAQNWIGTASSDRSTGYGYSTSMTMQRVRFEEDFFLRYLVCNTLYVSLSKERITREDGGANSRR